MKKVLITHPSFHYLGEKISQNIGCGHLDIRFERFPDTWPNLFLEDVEQSIGGCDVTYIGDFSRPEDFFINYSLMRGILDYGAGKLNIIMPYFPVGTMERISVEGEIATAKYFADIMSHLPSGSMGKTSIHTFDIHALSERFLFDSFRVNFEAHTAMKYLEEIAENKVIVFPDEGAEKRFSGDFPDHETIVLSKKRKGTERIMELKQGDPNGKDLLLVDDLIQSGGTLIKAAEFLRSLGALSVSAYATHGVFPNGSFKKLCNSLNALYVTDSIPDNIQRAKEIANMSIISLSASYKEIIIGE